MRIWPFSLRHFGTLSASQNVSYYDLMFNWKVVFDTKKNF
ncbi:hypothetical protein BofuT4_uP154900.1 [Botrytis cinerea T4]|uniref:Uncharacterized protein n=1 Tax=Botryotinia fuckeliana (strain T4) TaxID=999810 RepID=G2YV51_BOTF4|nr:hypothetical protein BofuT4_uP154900.1 [Botrytis cinerea T4]